jgi:hypothetical protein
MITDIMAVAASIDAELSTARVELTCGAEAFTGVAPLLQAAVAMLEDAMSDADLPEAGIMRRGGVVSGAVSVIRTRRRQWQPGTFACNRVECS